MEGEDGLRHFGYRDALRTFCMQEITLVANDHYDEIDCDFCRSIQARLNVSMRGHLIRLGRAGAAVT